MIEQYDWIKWMNEIDDWEKLMWLINDINEWDE